MHLPKRFAMYGGDADKKRVELVGRNLLLTEMLRGDIEVAMPQRDRGIDLVAYLDRDLEFLACPVQLKASSRRCFSIHKKYERIPNLVMAYVWNVVGTEPHEFYAMTYQEALSLAQLMGYTRTPSWTERGEYVSANPSLELKAQIAKHRVAPDGWIRVLRKASQVPPVPAAPTPRPEARV